MLLQFTEPVFIIFIFYLFSGEGRIKFRVVPEKFHLNVTDVLAEHEYKL